MQWHKMKSEAQKIGATLTSRKHGSMKGKEAKKETVMVSRLGCMRTSTVSSQSHWGTVEHVEVWVPTGEADAPAESDAAE